MRLGSLKRRSVFRVSQKKLSQESSLLKSQRLIKAPKRNTEFVRIISTDTSSRLQNILTKVVKSGTARNASLDDYLIGGKTGTAENPHGETHAWYVGFANYKDEDMISVVVLVENGGGGGSIASPIARKIFKKYDETINHGLAELK